MLSRVTYQIIGDTDIEDKVLTKNSVFFVTISYFRKSDDFIFMSDLK